MTICLSHLLLICWSRSAGATHEPCPLLQADIGTALPLQVEPVGGGAPRHFYPSLERYPDIQG
jgi:hypothetical protein